MVDLMAVDLDMHLVGWMADLMAGWKVAMSAVTLVVGLVDLLVVELAAQKVGRKSVGKVEM